MGNKKTKHELDIEEMGGVLEQNGLKCKVKLLRHPTDIYMIDNTFYVLLGRDLYEFSGEMNIVEQENGVLFDKISGRIIEPGKHFGRKRISWINSFKWFCVFGVSFYGCYKLITKNKNHILFQFT